MRLFCLILFVGLLSISAGAEVFTSPDGYKFGVELNLQKSSVMLGEPTFVDFEVKNLSDVELGVLWGGDYRNEFGRPESFNVKIIDSKGEVLPKPKLYNFGGLSGFQKIEVGKTFNFRLYLPHWATLEKTGKYKIEIEKNLVVRKYERDKMKFEVSPQTNTIKLNGEFSVVAADYIKMGEVIDEIGKKVVERDDTAERLVPFINDFRIIKYLAQAIEKNIWLMRHLAKFNDDRALNAIVSRLKDEDQETRRNVSVSLALSVHPKAASYLLQMRFDKFYAIRLDVIHYLGRTKTAESTKLLYEMLNDENKQNSGEAKRYLLERGEKSN